ncbi:MAG: histidine phosphatase family protein [Lachnospiraceae bacterium]|nr:histidine phosphatase family protein [Lachnospiraceae bacterium]
MTGNLYVIRHGRTDWNDIPRLQGHTDIPLNASGIKMAEEAAERYRDVHFDIVFCSPLKRAAMTAEILLKGRNIPVIYDDRLEEMNFGIYEGTENYFDDPACPVNIFFTSPETYHEAPPGGESIDDLMNRTGEFLNEKVRPFLEGGKDVLIVGHGAMNSAIITRIRNLPLEDFWNEGIENCKLKKLL